MSTSAVIRFWEDTKDEHPIGLYLHADGGSYAENLIGAIDAAQGRWDDPDYANRIAIQYLLSEMNIEWGDLGAGLFVGTDSRGEDLPVLNVNWGSKVVWNHDQRIPFEQYINGEWKVVQ